MYFDDNVLRSQPASAQVERYRLISRPRLFFGFFPCKWAYTERVSLIVNVMVDYFGLTWG